MSYFKGFYVFEKVTKKSEPVCRGSLDDKTINRRLGHCFSVWLDRGDYLEEDPTQRVERGFPPLEIIREKITQYELNKKKKDYTISLRF